MYFTDKKTLCTFLHHGNLQHYGRRSLVGYSPWGRQESDMTERLHFHFSTEGLEERSCPLADVWCSTPTACTLLRLNFELKVPDQKAIWMLAYWLHTGQEHPFSLGGLFSGNIKHAQTQLGRCEGRATWTLRCWKSYTPIPAWWLSNGTHSLGCSCQHMLIHLHVSGAGSEILKLRDFPGGPRN